MMRKHAYIIVANSISEVLCTCIEMLDNPLNDIFILFDKKAHLLQAANCLQQNVRYSHISFCEQIVNWGGYSQIDAVIRLLKNVINERNEYAYIHFFQGSDLPIKSQCAIRDFCEKHDGKEFVSVELGRKKMAENKCHYYHFFCHNRFFRKNRMVKALNFGLVAIQKALKIQHNTDVEVYQGSALFSITPAFASYLVEHEQEIRQRFRFALAADECFIQTMIMKSPFKEYLYLDANGESLNARLIDRTRPDGKNSPHIWRDDELKYVLSQPEEMCFARKFDSKIAPHIVESIREKCK